MKIYHSSTSRSQQRTIVDNLLNNDLPIFDKIKNLIGAYNNLQLAHGAMRELIAKLIQYNGGETRFPRKGDNNERFDMVATFPNYDCMAEIEIPSTGILDAPRNLLDDYAILSQRHHNSISKTTVLVVICWDLPNRRTDYWNVISDIEKVLHIKIKTISIIALAIHYWLGKKANLENDDFFLDCNNEKMQSTITLLNLNNVQAATFRGYLEPLK